MVTALAVALIIIGLMNLLLKDLVWGLTFSGSVIEGLPAERNESWDRWMNIVGAVALAIGLYLWFF
jgi:hypothetical protein